MTWAGWTVSGRSSREKNEPVFHAEWEQRMYGLVMLVIRATQSSLDEFRHAIERIPPAQYLASSYYERWLAAAESLLVEHGVVTREELLAKEDASIDPALIANAVPARGPTPVKDKSLKKPPRARFVKGDRVRGRNLNPSGHTRLPRYVRGKSGVIARDWGVFVYPDTNAHRAGTKPQHCYSVAFDARELWGKSANSARAGLHRSVGRLPGADRHEIEIAKAQTRDAHEKE